MLPAEVAEPAIRFIPELRTEFVVEPGMVDDQIARRWAAATLDSLRRVLAGSTGVGRSTEADFVAAFIGDLLGGGAWNGPWQYEIFASVRGLPTRVAIRRLVEEHRDSTEAILRSLGSRGGLSAALDALGEETLRDLVDVPELLQSASAADQALTGVAESWARSGRVPQMLVEAARELVHRRYWLVPPVARATNWGRLYFSTEPRLRGEVSWEWCLAAALVLWDCVAENQGAPTGGAADASAPEQAAARQARPSAMAPMPRVRGGGGVLTGLDKRLYRRADTNPPPSALGKPQPAVGEDLLDDRAVLRALGKRLFEGSDSKPAPAAGLTHVDRVGSQVAGLFLLIPAALELKLQESAAACGAVDGIDGARAVLWALAHRLAGDVAHAHDPGAAWFAGLDASPSPDVARRLEVQVTDDGDRVLARHRHVLHSCGLGERLERCAVDTARGRLRLTRDAASGLWWDLEAGGVPDASVPSDEVRLQEIAALCPEQTPWPLARVTAVLGQGLVRRFAGRLPGFEQSTVAYLLRNFIHADGVIEQDAEGVRVTLNRVPLGVVLRLYGPGESAPVPWLGGRRVTIEIGT